MHRGYAASPEDPVVEGVAVVVLVRAESMSDTLDRVENRAHEVVSGIDLELGANNARKTYRTDMSRQVPNAVVRLEDATVEVGIAQDAVVVCRIDLGAEDTLDALICALLHLLPQLKVLLDGLVAGR